MHVYSYGYTIHSLGNQGRCFNMSLALAADAAFAQAVAVGNATAADGNGTAVEEEEEEEEEEEALLCEEVDKGAVSSGLRRRSSSSLGAGGRGRPWRTW